MARDLGPLSMLDFDFGLLEGNFCRASISRETLSVDVIPLQTLMSVHEIDVLPVENCGPLECRSVQALA